MVAVNKGSGTTMADQAKIKAYNEAIAQGLSEDQAFAASGITGDEVYDYTIDNVGSPDPTKANYNPNYGQLNPASFGRVTSGAPDAQSQTIDPQISAASTTANEPPVFIEPAGDPYPTVTSSSAVTEFKTQTFTENTVTGGGSTTTYVQPTEYRNTPASAIYEAEANRVKAEKLALTEELKAEGKTGREILRDPRYRELNAELNSYEVAAYETREPVPGTGGITVVQNPGSAENTTIYEKSTPASVVDNAGTEDPNAQLQDIEAVDLQERVETSSNITNTGDFVYDPDTGELLPADSAAAQQITDEQNRVEYTQPDAVGGSYTAYYDVETGEFNVRDDATGEDVATGLSESEANSTAAAYSIGDPGYGDPQAQQDADNPRQYGTQTDPGDAALITAKVQQARQQKTIQEQRKSVNADDWRVRLRLAPQAKYLYNDPSASVLAPLRNTDGVIFPYTPRIDVSYIANYSQEALTHSNYLQYFYQGSQVQGIQVNATFTAQDTQEANYLLAVIHFFRSCTKMFYGQDTEAGSPPPLVYLSGLGTFQFNEHPCVVQQFNYNLPDDVDYIRAGSPNVANNAAGTLNANRPQQNSIGTGLLAGVISAIGSPALAALAGQGIQFGANPMSAFQGISIKVDKPTYVPTKLEISLILLPVVSRRGVSSQFSLKGYANGDLLRKGFW